LAREIQHRSANLLLVMTSLVRQSVPDAAVAVTLIDRMRTVAKSDNLLDPSRGPGPARLTQLVEDTVRRPYGTHVSVAGPDVGLAAAQAHGLRLMLHEMATNAAKYGALSDGRGRVSIEWHRDGDALKIVWRESGGPTVAPPSRSGFGSKLIQTMLQEIDATLVPAYAASGYGYTITLLVAEAT
jgi:two-component sensor histidine kinase